MQKLRTRANAILSVTGIRDRGFYTPYDYAASAEWETEDYPAVRSAFAAAEDRFASFLAEIDANEERFLRIAAEPAGPSFASRYLSAFDAASVYTSITSLRPARVIEIGAGHTTRFMARAVSDSGLATTILTIDPDPRIPVTSRSVKLERRLLAASDAPLFATLKAGDLVFVDSSHIVQQGFDVDIILNRILPALAPGVVVHFHDVFLPYPYPPDWKYLRFNEQCALMPWILSGVFEPVFASHYVWRDMRDRLAAICPRFPLDTPDNGGSLYLRKV